MVGLQWSEAMSVGVPALDDDHRCLVRIINLLENVRENDSSQVADRVLDTLGMYCRCHFAREEQVMAACEFPALTFHRSEHEKFTEMVHRLRERHSADQESGHDSNMVRELLERLTAWLRHHILIQDMAYKPYVQERWDGTATLPEMPPLSHGLVGMSCMNTVVETTRQ